MPATMEKTVPVLNTSKTGRRYDIGEGKSIKAGESVEVSEKQAEFLLSKLPTGKARFEDLIDARKFSPAVSKERDELMAENKRLLKENEDLRAKMSKGEKK